MEGCAASQSPADRTRSGAGKCPQRRFDRVLRETGAAHLRDAASWGFPRGENCTTQKHSTDKRGPSARAAQRYFGGAPDQRGRKAAESRRCRQQRHDTALVAPHQAVGG